MMVLATVTPEGALFPWGWQNTCLPVLSDEFISTFVFPMHVAFALPMKPSLNCHFCSFDICPYHAIGESEWLCGE